MNTIKDEIIRLRDELNIHNHKYYVLGKPEISDYEFDVMMRQLEDLERAYPEMYDPNSPTQRVGGETHGDQRKQYQRRASQGIADGHGHAGTYHGGSKTADGVAQFVRALFDDHDGLIQEADAELGTDGAEDGAHQQGAEEALGHGAEGVDAVALEGKDDVFACEEFLELFHFLFSFP